MRFAEPQILHWLWLAPVIGLCLYGLYTRRQKISIRFIGRGTTQGMAKDVLLIIAYVFIVFALARPQWGYEIQKMKRQGLDVLVAVDVSKSMLTQDVKPSRLERTKLAVKDLVKKLKGDRIGLIAFAGQAFLTCPLTNDYNGFLLALDDLSPDTIPRGGTDIAKAIAEALKSFTPAAEEHKAFVLVTDGEEEQGNAADVAHKAKDKGVKIYTVGIGTQEGDLVRVQNEQGEWEFLKDKQGNFIKSRLNERLLQEIAYITGGAYIRSSGAQFGLDYLYDRELSKLGKRDFGDDEDRKYHERFQWFLSIAVLSLMAAMLWPLLSFPKVSKTFGGDGVGMLLVVIWLFSPSLLWAKGINDANRLYVHGKYDEAVEVYQKAADADVKNSLAQYDLGTALYKKGDFDRSAKYLQQSLAAKEPNLRLNAQYNLGNALYRSGMARQKQDIDGAIASLQKSLDNFDDVIKTDAKDADARYNRDIVQKELERLKKKKEEQKQQQQQKQQQKDQEQKDKDQQKDQHNQQDQSKDQNGNREEQKQNSSEEQKKQEQQKQNEQQGQSQAEKARAMEEQQARNLLQEYERNEAPAGLLNFIPKKGKEQDVDKDW